MDDNCAWCGKTVKNPVKWKNKTFCSSKCRKGFKLHERKKEGKERQTIPLRSSAFDQLYWK